MLDRSVSAFPARFCRRGSRWAVILLLLHGVSAFMLQTGCAESRDTVKVHFLTEGGTRTPIVTAELATTPGQRNLGLMYRKELRDDQGMLFIFPKEEERSFWMKNTYLELDMIFIDAQMKVVSVTHRAVPLTQTARRSNYPAKYVLEVNGGLARRWGIERGSALVVDGGIGQPK